MNKSEIDKSVLDEIIEEANKNINSDAKMIEYLFDNMFKMPLDMLFKRHNKGQLRKILGILELPDYSPFVLTYGELALIIDEKLKSDESENLAGGILVQLSQMQLGFEVDDTPSTKEHNKPRYYEDFNASYIQSQFFLIDLHMYLEYLNSTAEKTGCSDAWLDSVNKILQTDDNLYNQPTLGSALREAYIDIDKAVSDAEDNEDESTEYDPSAENLVRHLIIEPFAEYAKFEKCDIKEIIERINSFA